MKIRYIPCFLYALLLVSGCETKQSGEKQSMEKNEHTDHPPRSYEAISLLGDTLYTLDLPEKEKQFYEAALQEAEHNFQENPDDLNNIIWLGRRLSNTGRFQDAIKVYTEGMQKFSDSPELFRHRGQCYITTRQFDKAVQDLEKSVELAKNMPITIESEGIPRPLPSPEQPSTLQYKIWYHLGAAYYLTSRFGKAAQAYEQCLTYGEHDDEIAAAADWLYMTYRRLGEDEVAEKTLDLIREDMQLQQSAGYFERLLMYKGEIEPDSLLQLTQDIPLADRNFSFPAQVYGVGNYYLMEGDTAKGMKILKDIIDSRYWAALDYIAAEVDLAREKDSLQENP